MAMHAPVQTDVRSGLHADGPDWDRGIDTSRWNASMGPHPLGEAAQKEPLPSMAKQEFRDECDINSIMARYEKTGVMPSNPGGRMYEFGDAISEYSYQESLDAVRHAQAEFMTLSARVRDRFGNDPANLFAFLDDPKNRDEAVKLGLLDPPAVDPPPQKVEVVNPPQQTPAGTAGK